MGKAQLEYPRGLDFEQVWAAIMELRESQKETDRLIQENARRQEEAARRQEEAARRQEEAARRQEEVARQRQEEAARRQEENDRRQEEVARQRQEEAARRQEENDRRQEEAARQRQEEAARRQEENDRRQEEAARRQEENDRQIKEYNRRFGEFTNRFGEIVEYMVAPNLREKFRELGLNFPSVNSERDIADTKNGIFLEIDVYLENGDKVMLVETKTKPTTGDVKEHLKRLEKMRKYADLHGDKRKILGAVAGVVMTNNVKQHILKQGFFAVEPSGETFNIISPQGQPREW